jgi:hypothetical protein
VDFLELTLSGSRFAGALRVTTEVGATTFTVTTQVLKVRGRVRGHAFSFDESALGGVVIGKLEPRILTFTKPALGRWRLSSVRQWRRAQATLRNEVAVDNKSENLAVTFQTLDDAISNAADLQSQLVSDVNLETAAYQRLFQDANESVGGGVATLLGPGGKGSVVSCDAATRAEADYSGFEQDAQQIADDLGFADQAVRELPGQSGALNAATRSYVDAKGIVPHYVSSVTVPETIQVTSDITQATAQSASLTQLATSTDQGIPQRQEQAQQQLSRAVQPCTSPIP